MGVSFVPPIGQLFSRRTLFNFYPLGNRVHCRHLRFYFQQFFSNVLFYFLLCSLQVNQKLFRCLLICVWVSGYARSIHKTQLNIFYEPSAKSVFKWSWPGQSQSQKPKPKHVSRHVNAMAETKCLAGGRQLQAARKRERESVCVGGRKVEAHFYAQFCSLQFSLGFSPELHYQMQLTTSNKAKGKHSRRRDTLEKFLQI